MKPTLPTTPTPDFKLADFHRTIKTEFNVQQNSRDAGTNIQTDKYSKNNYSLFSIAVIQTRYIGNRVIIGSGKIILNGCYLSFTSSRDEGTSIVRHVQRRSTLVVRVINAVNKSPSKWREGAYVTVVPCCGINDNFFRKKKP